MTRDEAMARLEALADEKVRTLNIRNGAGEDQFGVKLGDIRKIAAEIKSDHALALELWATGNLDARLLAILILKPKQLSREELDRMVRENRVLQVSDWLNSYVVKAHPEKEALRQQWMRDSDPMAARAGWSLTAERVAKKPDGLDLDALLDRMVRENRVVQVSDWLNSYVVKAHPEKEALRQQWMRDSDPMAARAGWSLTAERVAKKPEGLDLAGLLDRIEAEMATAAPEPQWTMNNTLANIGIHNPDLRQRALAIGEKLGVYRDYPTSPGCTSPFAPDWINELVRRQAASA